MHYAVDKILLTHRNTKLFLLMMTGPFLVAMKLVWWALKAFLLYFVFNKVGKAKGITNGNGHAVKVPVADEVLAGDQPAKAELENRKSERN